MIADPCVHSTILGNNPSFNFLPDGNSKRSRLGSLPRGRVRSTSSSSGIIGGNKIEGGKSEIVVSDDNLQQSLADLVRQAKETNLHLQTITGNTDINEDIE